MKWVIFFKHKDDEAPAYAEPAPSGDPPDIAAVIKTAQAVEAWFKNHPQGKVEYTEATA